MKALREFFKKIKVKPFGDSKDGSSGPNVLANSTMTVSADGQEVVLTLPTKNNSYPYLVFNAGGRGRESGFAYQ